MRPVVVLRVLTIAFSIALLGACATPQSSSSSQEAARNLSTTQSAPR